MIYGIVEGTGNPASTSVGAIVFDESAVNNGLSITSATAADSNILTISLWARLLDYSDSPYVCLPAGPGASYSGSPLYIDYSGAVRQVLHNSVGDKQFVYGSAYGSEAFSVGQWHHIFTSANTNFAASSKIGNMLVDGADVYYSPDNTDIDSSFDIGVNGATFGIPTDGDTLNSVTEVIELAEVWIAFGQYLSPSDVIKFRTISGSPEDLGANGETPTGISPTYYFSGNASQFATNRGTGDQPTIIGSITDAATSP